MAERARSIPTPVRQTFTFEYARNSYEKLSTQHPRSYERAARSATLLDGGIKDKETVLEVGCGTGNSTIVLCESNPNFTRLVGVEPSEGFLAFAKYKFRKGNSSLLDQQDLEPEVRAYVEEQKTNVERIERRSPGFKDKVDFVMARSQALPLTPSSIDRAFALSVLHWTAFSDKDTERENMDYLSVTIDEFFRVLKPNGRLIIDSSGHQFDFQDEMYQGRPINSYHYLGHPFRKEFIRHFSETVNERGYNLDMDTISGGPNRFNRYFNLRYFERIFQESGLILVPTEEGGPYSITFIDQPADFVLRQIRDAGKMQFFKTPQLASLDEEEKIEILQISLNQTLEHSSELLKFPSAELFATFVFRKAA